MLVLGCVQKEVKKECTIRFDYHKEGGMAWDTGVGWVLMICVVLD